MYKILELEQHDQQHRVVFCEGLTRVIHTGAVVSNCWVSVMLCLFDAHGGVEWMLESACRACACFVGGFVGMACRGWGAGCARALYVCGVVSTV